MSNTIGRVVLTLAVGKPVYLLMAFNLARSFKLWHRNSDIGFILATDCDVTLPADLVGIQVVKLKMGQYGSGFSPKLYLDQISPACETLFLDADCLCVAPLGPVFDRFANHQVSVVGRTEAEGELFGDVARRCRQVGVPWTVRFCGGLYFLRKGATCDAVFGSARELESRYDELGLTRLRGVPNEEPLIGLGMALAGAQPVIEDGSIKAEPMFFSGRTEIDVFAGHARLFDLAGKPKPYPEWKLPAEVRPRIVHFNASFAEHPPYTVEAMRLKLVLHDHWPLWLATTFAKVMQGVPFYLATVVKGIFRPLYRKLFGARTVRPSPRLQGFESSSEWTRRH